MIVLVGESLLNIYIHTYICGWLGVIGFNYLPLTVVMELGMNAMDSNDCEERFCFD